MDAGRINFGMNKKLQFGQRKYETNTGGIGQKTASLATAAVVVAHGVPHGHGGAHSVHPYADSFTPVNTPAAPPAGKPGKDEGSDPHAELGEEKVREEELKLEMRTGASGSADSGRAPEPNNIFGGPFIAPHIYD